MEIELYCSRCGEITTWKLDNETTQVQVWECKGCDDIWFEEK